MARGRGRKRRRLHDSGKVKGEDVFGEEWRSIVEIKCLGNGWNNIYDIRLFRDPFEDLSCSVFEIARH